MTKVKRSDMRNLEARIKRLEDAVTRKENPGKKNDPLKREKNKLLARVKTAENALAERDKQISDMKYLLGFLATQLADANEEHKIYAVTSMTAEKIAEAFKEAGIEETQDDEQEESKP